MGPQYITAETVKINPALHSVQHSAHKDRCATDLEAPAPVMTSAGRRYSQRISPLQLMPNAELKGT